MEKWLIQNWGQKYTRWSELGHLIVLESKEALEREEGRKGERKREEREANNAPIM